MGAAVQGCLIAGVDVGPVLVDITPHTIGIETLGILNGVPSTHGLSPIIVRNTPLPAKRTDIFTTVADGQTVVDIRVFQGEDEDTRYSTLIGSFKIEGLANVGSLAPTPLAAVNPRWIIRAPRADQGRSRRCSISPAAGAHLSIWRRC